MKGRPVSAEQRPAATNPVSGRGLGRQPGGSNTTDLAENEFGLLAAIVSLLREFGAARSIVCNQWSFRLVATPAEIEPRGVLIVTRLDRLARSTRDLLNVLDAVAKAKAGFRSLRNTSES